MSLTEDLEIYKPMYRLLRLLIAARNQFDKPYKYVVGDRLINTALECITLIHFANEDRRKGARVEHLNNFLIQFDILKTLIMVCRDERQFNKKKGPKIDAVFIEAADVEIQATAWRRDAAARKPES